MERQGAQSRFSGTNALVQFANGILTDFQWVHQRRLQAEGFDAESDLDATIAKTEKTLQRARNKELGIEEEEKVRWRSLHGIMLPADLN